MQPRGVRGWLAVLVVLLLVWQPVSLGLVASSVVDAVAIRGVSLALVLLLRVLVAAFGIAAGIALVGERPSAVAMAKASLIASALVDLFVDATPYFPNNRMPGDTPFYVAASLAYSGVWLMYLVRSRRVRNTFGA
ncbi:MAG TPA: hypothetical protein VFA27_16595 [Vicinamibacterales bacterium]|nr:hypothetical protein [Vicinamibacterales bacterium]